MSAFVLEILSPEGTAFKGEASLASFPTASGIITVLPGHANLVTILKKGEISFDTQEGKKKVTITGGFLEISEHAVNVLAEFAIPSDELNRQKIEAAMQFAKELQEKKKDAVDISVIENQLKRTIGSLKSGVNLKRKL